MRFVDPAEINFDLHDANKSELKNKKNKRKKKRMNELMNEWIMKVKVLKHLKDSPIIMSKKN